MTKRTTVLLALFISLIASSCSDISSGEDRVADSTSHVSVRAFLPWQVVTSENARQTFQNRSNQFTRAIGFDRKKAGIVAFKFEDNSEIIPVIQIGVSNISGLTIDADNLDSIKSKIEEKYSERAGNNFRVFVIENTTLAGLSAIRLTGVYRWRTNNIKVLQFLIPGGEKFYSVTYSAQEREFSNHQSQVMQILETLRISDPPLLAGSLGSLVQTIVLVILISGIILGLFYSNSIKPQSNKPSFSLMRLLRPKGIKGKNPFLK